MDDTLFLQSVANVLATALERKRTEEALKESEQRFRTLVESMDDIVFTLDRNGRHVGVFGRWVERAGLTPETFIGKTAGEILGTEAAPIHEAANARALEGQNVIYEWSLPGSEGTLHYQTSLSPIRDSEGSITGIVGLGRDITQQKETESKLRRSEERFRRYYELGLIGMTICSPEGIWVEINDRLCEMLGYSREELLDKHWREFTHPDDLEISHVHFQRVLAGEIDDYIIDKRFIRKDGGVVYTNLSTKSLRREGGSVDHFVVLIQDITEHVRAEDALRIQRNLAIALSTTSDLEQALDHLLDAALQIGGLDSGGVYLVDPPTGDLDLLSHRGLSPRFVAQVSYIAADTPQGRLVAAGEPVYQRYDKLFSETKDEARVSEGLGALAVIPITYEDQAIAVLNLASHSRDEIPASNRALLETIAAQAGEAIVRVKIQAERESLLAQVREIMNTVPEGVLLLDNEGRVILTNPVALHDLQDLAGIGVGDILTHLGDRELSDLLSSPPKGFWHEVKSEKRTLEVITRPMTKGPDPERWVMVVRDVTQEREIQQSIQQQERLAAVGQLAAGIAHDFNNILAVILLYTEIMLGAPNLDTRQRDRLLTISQQAKLASELIQQILDFSRRAVLERLSMDLLPFIKEQNRLLERTLPENIQINLSYQPGEYMVNADPVRLQQAVMNLALNARDAMPEGGELNLSLARSEPDEDIHCVTCGHIVDGEWMRVTISDTGSGIPDDVLPHIFEPFFTTKGPGQGTGLGLAQVYGILKQHEGHLDVLSRMGKGSAFNLYLPALPTAQGQSLDLEAGSLIMGQGQTILLVEDELVTQQAMVEGLSLLNYQVIPTANGREALDLLEQRGKGIDLVLSDVVMPEMGGIALFQALRERGLTIPVILMTGHPMQEELEDLRSEGLPAWMLKPPRLKQLAEIVALTLISG
jgi:PAS domain S-box-containing protein